MNPAFDFATAGRIVFGCGRRTETGAIAREFGQRTLLVTGRDPSRAESVHASLVAAGGEVIVFPVSGEPTINLVEAAGRRARETRCEVVIGFGGGSVIDTAKAAAALATNPGTALDYLEVIGAGRPLSKNPLPCLALPTTAGTGAEVTRNAVLHSPDHHLKVSLRSPRLLPRVALVDPDVLVTLPEDVMISTGMDALTQLIEAFVSCRANLLTDALCREALPRIARSLVPAVRDRANVAARVDLAFASLCSGLVLANAGLGAVHGLAAPLGGMYGAPHGAICAALLAPVLRANLEVAQIGEGNRDTVVRFAELAGLLTAGQRDQPGDLIEWVEELARSLTVRGLLALGVPTIQHRVIAERARDASSMRGNPVRLSVDQLAAILDAAG